MAASLLLGAELAYRWWRFHSLDLPPTMYAPDTLLAFRLNEANELFRYSFVGDGFPGGRDSLLVVLCLGGSTTFGHGVSAAQAWPGALRDSLRALQVPAAVINAGVSGYGSRQLLLRYRQQIAALQPDVVIVYEGWNRTGILSDSASWDPFGVGLRWRALVSLGRHSLLARRALGWHYQRRQIALREWRPEPLQAAWEADMDSLFRDIGANGQRAVAVLYPGLYHRGMTSADREAYAGKGWKGRAFDPRMLDEREAKHDALRRIASRHGAPLLDAEAAFADRHGPARLALFLDEMHLSSQGHARLAGLAARQLAASARRDAGRGPPNAAPPPRARTSSISTTPPPR